MSFFMLKIMRGKIMTMALNLEQQYMLMKYCNEYLIDSGIALENEELKKNLINGNYKKVKEIFINEF